MKRRIDRERERPLLDIASFARRGSSDRVTLIAAEVAHVIRTARYSPEVVVKVSGGASTLRGVGAHLDYIGREGELEIETDDGQRISERGFEQQILKDWDLDLEERRGARQRAITRSTRAPACANVSPPGSSQTVQPGCSTRISVVVRPSYGP